MRSAPGVFKRSAEKLSGLIATLKPGTDVTVNAEKPRKGAFVVTVEGAKEPVVQLLARHFPALYCFVKQELERKT